MHPGDGASERLTPSPASGAEYDESRLSSLRRLDAILAVGRDDAARSNNEYLSTLLGAKHIPHALRIWDGWCHDWPYWVEMIRRYIGGNA